MIRFVTFVYQSNGSIRNYDSASDQWHLSAFWSPRRILLTSWKINREGLDTGTRSPGKKQESLVLLKSNCHEGCGTAADFLWRLFKYSWSAAPTSLPSRLSVTSLWRKAFEFQQENFCDLLPLFVEEHHTDVGCLFGEFDSAEDWSSSVSRRKRVDQWWILGEGHCFCHYVIPKDCLTEMTCALDVNGIGREIQDCQYLERENKIATEQSQINYSVHLQSIGQISSALLSDMIGSKIEFSEHLKGNCSLLDGEKILTVTVLLHNAILRQCAPSSRSWLFSRFSTARLCCQRHHHSHERKD